MPYPFNTNGWRRTAQTDTAGVTNSLLTPVWFDLGSPAAPDDDYFYAAANMKVGAYTLLQTSLAVARNIVVTTTDATGADTKGTLTIVGTDMNGDALTEEITIAAAAGVTAGLHAFKTVASMTGAGWVINGGNDQIKIGFGDALGLPDKLGTNTVMAAIFNDARESTAPTVTASATVLSLNTVDLQSASNGSAIQIIYFV